MSEERTPMMVAITTYMSYAILIFFGHLRDFFGGIFRRKTPNKAKDGYAILLADFDNFYTRRLYGRIQDCWNRPIASCPGREIDVLVRESKDYNKTLTVTNKTQRCLNLSSYNYLGFGDPDQEVILNNVRKSIKDFSVSPCAPRAELGTTRAHVELEELVARFCGKPAAMCYGMGFATNSTTIPALISKGGLIISDALNHTSIVQGCRASGAHIRTFSHNDPEHLETVMRESIAYGQPRTRRPWTKILVIVEGIYSMEGEIVKLREIVDVVKKYKGYIYLDEAHSIGALGSRGGGACDYCDVDPAEIDIMMGTFTKSFGSVGGYIAASQEVIDALKVTSLGFTYACSMSPPCAQQALSAMKVILGEENPGEGQRRLTQLRENARYFRSKLEEMKFLVFGDDSSPVIPLMLYHPCKMPAFSRECLKEDLAVVVVGYPATPIITSRARFCISAAHTRADLDLALEKISRIGDKMLLKYENAGLFTHIRENVVPWAIFFVVAASTAMFAPSIASPSPVML